MVGGGKGDGTQESQTGVHQRRGLLRVEVGGVKPNVLHRGPPQQYQ